MRKNIYILKQAATRAVMAGTKPASDDQIKLIAHLLEKKGATNQSLIDEKRLVLTAKKAKIQISILLKNNKNL